VVTDLQMPDLDGLELCRRLRRTPATAKLLIVVVSADAVTQRDQAIAAGCDVVLEKPCSPALLVTTIQRLLVKRFRSTRTH
jgi:CheY-like chemotaxis protein